MSRLLLRSLSRYYTCKLPTCPPATRNFRFYPTSNQTPFSSVTAWTCTSSKFRRLFSSESDLSTQNHDSDSKLVQEDTSLTPQEPVKKNVVSDIGNQELKARIEKYFKGDETALPEILEAILARKLTGKHSETDDELMDELQMKPLTDVKDKEFEDAFEDLYKTDDEMDNLYDAADVVKQKMVQDEYFNMDENKWDAVIKDATNRGYLKDMKECEDILEDMLKWDNLLPAEIKQKVEQKFNELGDMVERGEIPEEEGLKLFQEFENKVVLEHAKVIEAEGSPQFDDDSEVVRKGDPDDQPGKGPILRWETRVVFSPGGEAWHPKNRKVKMAVTVKELGLSKHQSRRLRELVGKRYNSGKDELTITSERFEHREENRKDCLRTLYDLIEEAGKADKLVEEARTSFFKGRLKANPQFMERLRAKAMAKKESLTA